MTVDSITTLVLRDLPQCFDEAKVTQGLKDMGLENACDFVYVPTLQMTPPHSRNAGFAIVNFVHAAAADDARKIIGATGIQVGTAPLQGRLAHSEQSIYTCLPLSHLVPTTPFCSIDSVRSSTVKIEAKTRL